MPFTFRPCGHLPNRFEIFDRNRIVHGWKNALVLRDSMRLIILVAACVLQVACAGMLQYRQTGFLDRIIQIDGVMHRYQVYVPSNYDPDVQWPVILFLHGAGERGSDGLQQTEVGLGSAIRRYSERYPALVVFPQGPENSPWPGAPAKAAMAALEQTVQEFSADQSRLYLTGMSMGGHGAWYLAYNHPNRFAAVVVVCGFLSAGEEFPPFVPPDSSPPTSVVAWRLQKLPIWVYHGDADPIVPITASREMVESLRGFGAIVQYTEFPGVGHNSWDAAYRSPELPVWLFSQRKPSSVAPPSNRTRN